MLMGKTVKIKASGLHGLTPFVSLRKRNRNLKAVLEANWIIHEIIGNHFNAEPSPEAADFKISPERSTTIIKRFARHIGADLVGICKVDHQWRF